jgi:hypothetical protein
MFVTTASFKKEIKTISASKKTLEKSSINSSSNGKIAPEAINTSSRNKPNQDDVIEKYGPVSSFQTAETGEESNITDNPGSLHVQSSEEAFLGYIQQNIIYPQEARENNLKASLKVLVVFEKNKVILQDPEYSNATNAKEFKEVVVMAYGHEGISIRSTQESEPYNQNEPFKKELVRILGLYTDIPQDLVGKAYLLPIKFTLISAPDHELQKEIKVTGYAGKKDSPTPSGGDMYKIIGETSKDASKEPIVILDNEKIISMENMKNINPDSIQSIEVLKGKKIEHKQLGVLDGFSVIIITRKKKS